MEQILATMGTQTIGFILLYWYIDKTMKNNLENNKINAQIKISEMESHKEDFDKLCEKMDKMVDAMHDIVTKDTQRMIKLEQEVIGIKDMYIRTANKIGDIHEKTIEIRALVSLCPNGNKEEEIDGK